ncbi:TPA: hypothetical protein ACKPF3_005831, partial [Pseudomonas aeruginosa]
PVDLDHVQEIAIGAGGAEHLVPWIRPARGIKKEGASALLWFPSGVTRRESYRQSSMEHRAITSQARFQVLPDVQALSSVHAWQNDP